VVLGAVARDESFNMGGQDGRAHPLLVSLRYFEVVWFRAHWIAWRSHVTPARFVQCSFQTNLGTNLYNLYIVQFVQ
jgi:hypothetical protein